MLNVKLVCVGNLKEAYLRDAVKEYEKRLGAYCRFTTAELKEDSQLPVWAPVAPPGHLQVPDALDEGAAQLSCVKLTTGLPRPAPLADGRRPALWFRKGIKRLLEPTRHSLMQVFLHQHSLSAYYVQVLHWVLNIG